jgi:hypothetical protein
MPRNNGSEEVRDALGFTSDMTLVLKHTQLSPNGGRGGRQHLPDLVGSGAPRPIEGVHDLALAPGKHGTNRPFHCGADPVKQMLLSPMQA